MPYTIKKQGDKWIVTKKGGNKVLGKHESRSKAEQQLKALYANEK